MICVGNIVICHSINPYWGKITLTNSHCFLDDIQHFVKLEVRFVPSNEQIIDYHKSLVMRFSGNIIVSRLYEL
jgi:hypothetical protein